MGGFSFFSGVASVRVCTCFSPLIKGEGGGGRGSCGKKYDKYFTVVVGLGGGGGKGKLQPNMTV